MTSTSAPPAKAHSRIRLSASSGQIESVVTGWTGIAASAIPRSNSAILSMCRENLGRARTSRYSVSMLSESTSDIAPAKTSSTMVAEEHAGVRQAETRMLVSITTRKATGF